SLQQKWILVAYIPLRHVLVRCVVIDRCLLYYRLADIGAERDFAVTVPDFNCSARLCSYTEFIFTATSHFVQLDSKPLDLVV
ncbi:LysR family transcriptional regulator, partial [Vibrio parahaemolyticus]|nr:LysR family transcriptional regulator [Vibrio parahaemolyticus]